MILAGFALGIGELDEVILHTLCAILSMRRRGLASFSFKYCNRLLQMSCECVNELLYQNEVLILIEYVYTSPIKMKT